VGLARPADSATCIGPSGRPSEEIRDQISRRRSRVPVGADGDDGLHSTLSLPLLVATCVLAAAAPAAALVPPLAGLAGLVIILAALIVVETTRYAQARRSLRGT
jgi:Flp pilus assembly protein TadB